MAVSFLGSDVSVDPGLDERREHGDHVRRW